ncbi:MAG: ankyrin repeat domain-containing protein [Chlamydiales bacterium]
MNRTADTGYVLQTLGASLPPFQAPPPPVQILDENCRQIWEVAQKDRALPISPSSSASPLSQRKAEQVQSNAILQLLIEDKFDQVEALTAKGLSFTPLLLGAEFLHELVQRKAVKAVNFLISKGFPCDQKNQKGQIPLHLAAQIGLLESLEQLLRHDLINCQDHEGWTPLHFATMGGHQAVVEKLLGQNADPHKVTKREETLLHLAVQYGRADLLLYMLLQFKNRMVDYADCEGVRPLHLAFDPQHFNPEIVEHLIEAGAIVDMRDNAGETPLHKAIRLQCREGAQLLLYRGANPNLLNAAEVSSIDLAMLTPHYAQALSLMNTTQLMSTSQLTLDEEASGLKSSERLYLEAFEFAYEAHDLTAQIHNLEKMANFAFKCGDLMKTAHLINGALALAQKHQISDKQEAFLQRLEELERQFLEKEWPQACSASYCSNLRDHREVLQILRYNVAADLKTPNVEIAMIQSVITNRYLRLLYALIDESIAVIQIPPSLSYAFIALGSLARKDACPFSKPAFAILLEKEADEDTVERFRQLSRFLQLKMINLGETRWTIIPPKSIAGELSEGVSLTPDGFTMAMNGLSPIDEAGHCQMIGTPEKLASFNFHSENKELLEHEMTIASMIYQPSLDDALVRRFLHHKQSRLKEKHLAITDHPAIPVLKKLRDEFRSNPSYEEAELTGFDIKKNLYDFLINTIQCLLFVKGLSHCDFLSGINLLEKHGVINSSGLTNLTYTYKLLTSLRMQAQLFYSEEKEILSAPLKSNDLQRRKLFQIPEDSDVMCLIYRALNPLYEAINLFVDKSDKAAFLKTIFDDRNATPLSVLLTDSPVQSRLFPESASSSQTGVKDSIRPPSITRKEIGELEVRLTELENDQRESDLAKGIAYCELGAAYSDLGSALKALVCFQKSLKLLENFYHGKPDATIATTQAHLGRTYQKLDAIDKAFAHFHKSYQMFKVVYGKDHPDTKLVKQHIDIVRHANLSRGIQQAFS